jgi:hypothetical protein
MQQQMAANQYSLAYTPCNPTPPQPQPHHGEEMGGRRTAGRRMLWGGRGMREHDEARSRGGCRGEWISPCGSRPRPRAVPQGTPAPPAPATPPPRAPVSTRAHTPTHARIGTHRPTAEGARAGAGTGHGQGMGRAAAAAAAAAAPPLSARPRRERPFSHPANYPPRMPAHRIVPAEAPQMGAAALQAVQPQPGLRSKGGPATGSTFDQRSKASSMGPWPGAGPKVAGASSRRMHGTHSTARRAIDVV